MTHRNGTRPRAWETRVGEIELLIPKKRSGPSYFPSFLEPRRRSEQAIVAVVLEAYVNGVSTRKVDRLVSCRDRRGRADLHAFEAVTRPTPQRFGSARRDNLMGAEANRAAPRGACPPCVERR